MARKTIDLDSVQPNGKRGETQRPAFTKINENFAEVYDGLDDVQNVIRETLDGATGLRISVGNRLINGAFRFWQRGLSRTVVSPLAVYVPDRFQIVCTGAGQIAASRQEFATPEFGVASYMNCDLSGSAASTEAFFTQPVEGVQTLAGSKVTLSMQTWARTPGKKIGVRFIQSFGTNGSTDVIIHAQAQEIGTAASLRSFTVDLPSITGKKVGPNSKLHVIVDLAAPAAYAGALTAQSGSFSFTCMQLQKGAVATEYEHRNDSEELLLCQRYYEKSYNVDVAPGTADGAGRDNQFYDRSVGVGSTSHIRCRVLKRATPAYTVYSDVTGAAGRIAGADGGVGTVTAIVNPGQSGAQVNYVSAAGTWGSSFHWTADAEI